MTAGLTTLALVATLILAACGSTQRSPGIAERGDGQPGGETKPDDIGEPSDDKDTTNTIDSATIPTAPLTDDGEGPATASVDFVLAAIEGADAKADFAATPFNDPTRGSPFDPAVLAGRLRELEAFSATLASVEPSSSAYPGAGPELAPACLEGPGLVCQVELWNSSGQNLASVIVYWFDGGVSDFSIVIRSANGAPIGIGEARCEPGYQVVHGGQTPDRFDIAVCVDQSGAVQYNGRVRHEVTGIRLDDACRQADDEWLARNGAFRYEVDGTISAARSTIEVFDGSNALIQDGPFTTVRFEPVADPTPC